MFCSRSRGVVGPQLVTTTVRGSGASSTGQEHQATIMQLRPVRDIVRVCDEALAQRKFGKADWHCSRAAIFLNT